MAAGYPLAGQLMDKIGAYAETQAEINPGVKVWWRWWCGLRDNELGFLGPLLKSPNPEVALSALDLYEAEIHSHPDPPHITVAELNNPAKTEPFVKAFGEKAARQLSRTTSVAGS